MFRVGSNRTFIEFLYTNLSNMECNLRYFEFQPQVSLHPSTELVVTFDGNLAELYGTYTVRVYYVPAIVIDFCHWTLFDNRTNFQFFFLMNMLSICQLNTGKEYVIDSFINTLINAINIIPLHLCDNELLIIACWSTRTLTHTQSRWLLTESGMHDLFHSSSKIEQQYVIQDDPL